MSFISFDKINIGADLGSQMQQYASMHAIAKETNKKIIFPESCMYSGWGLKFPNLVNVDDVYLSSDSLLGFTNILQEDGLIVDDRVFNLDPDKNYNFIGLFHLYHYWYPKYKDDIYNLTFNKEYEYEANLILRELKKHKPLVSIHVRRGDYLLHDEFCKLDSTYYNLAMKEFNSVKFVVFSNDIEWCKENITSDEEIVFLDKNKDYIDLILMSKCDHNIIANSSFSWWAAFFNKNETKTIICPKNYIKNKYKSLSFINGNYYPETWKSIDNICE